MNGRGGRRIESFNAPDSRPSVTRSPGAAERDTAPAGSGSGSWRTDPATRPPGPRTGSGKNCATTSATATSGHRGRDHVRLQASHSPSPTERLNPNGSPAASRSLQLREWRMGLSVRPPSQRSNAYATQLTDRGRNTRQRAENVVRATLRRHGRASRCSPSPPAPQRRSALNSRPTLRRLPTST
jgi:hypothetical protein